MIEMRESSDGAIRVVSWTLHTTLWDEFRTAVDEFATTAMREISSAYPDTPFNWINFNLWLDSGRLIIYPTDEDVFGDRNDRVCFQLLCTMVESMYSTINDSAPDELVEAQLDELSKRVWAEVEHALTLGRSAKVLDQVRRTHCCRLVCFDNDGISPGFPLVHLQPDIADELRTRYQEFCNQYGLE